jgi:NADH-quinone oxidoreductase subunit J
LGLRNLGIQNPSIPEFAIPEFYFEIQMNLYSVIFYILALIVLVTTFLAVTRRNIVHAVIYLIVSFLGTALLFYLLGAPFLAVLEAIIYAGGIMVLFLFIVMMIGTEPSARKVNLSQWLPMVILGIITLLTATALLFSVSVTQGDLRAMIAAPKEFGHFLFENYWFPVEVASFLLLIALVGALYLGKGETTKEER